MKTSTLLCTLFLLCGFSGIVKSQSHLYFATEAESFLDSSCKKKVRKLTKGECVLVENNDLYKKKYLYGTCIKDGKAGFIEKHHLKFEKTYFPDDLGKHPLEIAKQEFSHPFIRLVNTSHKLTIKVSLDRKTYVLAPGNKEEFHYKPGIHRFKVLAPGYQPSYMQETFAIDHISEIEFYAE